MTVLAHLSDPHIGPLPRARMRELAGKRALGFFNWHRRRKAIHRMETLTDLVADLKEQTPDQIALTGDLVNIALPAEFLNTRAFLHALGQPADVRSCPAITISMCGARPLPAASIGATICAATTARAFRICAGAAPLALDRIVERDPDRAVHGDRKARRGADRGIPRVAGAAKGEDLFRVVMIHHPPSRKRGDRFKYLIDTEAFAKVLREYGADLVLHGHDHVHSVVYLDGPDGKKVPMAGVPSASASGGARRSRRLQSLFDRKSRTVAGAAKR